VVNSCSSDFDTCPADSTYSSKRETRTRTTHSIVFYSILTYSDSESYFSLNQYIHPCQCLVDCPSVPFLDPYAVH
jgi:hypothetical protein